MSNEGFYFVEIYTENLIRNIKVEKVLFEGKTKYQYVQIFENQMMGKMLFLDKKIQSAAIDECIYHESLVHPADFPPTQIDLFNNRHPDLRRICR